MRPHRSRASSRRILILMLIAIGLVVWAASRTVSVSWQPQIYRLAATPDTTRIPSVIVSNLIPLPVANSKKKTAVELPPVTSPATSPEHRLQQQQWEINYLKNILQRKTKILEETHDEMLHAMGDLRSALRTAGSPPPQDGGGHAGLPCHCLEQSAMAPEDLWCENRRRRVSGAHVCVVRDVCFGGGEELLFLSPHKSDTERVSLNVRIAGTDQGGSVMFHPSSNKPRDDKSLYHKVMNTEFKKGTVVLYASKFPNHITHVLEGAGGLHFSIHRNELASNCSREDLTCFPNVAAFHFLGVHNSGEWHENVLRIMMQDYTKSVPIRYQGSIQGLPFQCFEKAIVPGFYYSVFPDSEDTASFQQATVKYLESNAKKSDEGKGWHSSPHRVGKILMSKRTSKRTIRDWDVLKQFITAFAANYTTTEGRSISVEEIEYGQHSFDEQASRTADADILLGIHGADLTNMLFMRRGSVIWELNPLFFFENRFYEIANNLGLHYMVWTCTTGDCAFGGDPSRFDGVVKRFGYDHATRRFPTNKGWLAWPYDRYLGYSCPECDRLGVPVMDFRDTDVRVGKSLSEIAEVLERSFTNLNWRRRG